MSPVSLENTSAPAVDTRDRPLRDLRISVTDRCNFRCTYCMPAEIFGEKYAFLPRKELLTFEEIELLVRVFVSLGVAKLRISGGEPLLRADLASLIAQVSQIDGLLDTALTTNATLLPRQAEGLRKAGLGRLTVSLDSLDEAVFRQMNGDKLSVAQVLDGIKAAEGAGFRRLKINCVVQKGVNDHTILGLARHFRHTGHILRFIEYMDVGTRNDWDLTHVVTYDEILETIGSEYPLRPLDPNHVGEVAKRFEYEDGSGELGLVTSVSRPFCGDCSRARLTTDGKLVTCLFAGSGVDLRGPLRDGASEDELREIVRGVWDMRSDRYSEERGKATTKRARMEMYQLGG
ncbi:MAG: GTP 3',8-cyclase MoaA [Myxococcota bacterium]|jgi:cyclic pyranopterin phosphate synthase|nr:GTP 3',8-cyclase MoaA [Myxococcota bacterium]